MIGKGTRPRFEAFELLELTDKIQCGHRHKYVTSGHIYGQRGCLLKLENVDLNLPIDPSISTLYSTPHFFATASHSRDTCTAYVFSFKIVAQKSGHTRTENT